MYQSGLAADALVDIGPRPVPQEPMVRDLNPLTHSPSHINPKIPPLPPIPLNIAFIPLSLTHTHTVHHREPRLLDQLWRHRL